jgi:Protein of unknown function (DUF3073)
VWFDQAMPPRQTRKGVDVMGRGRAKAKQTKVARELKYYSPSTDLSALERELHGPSAFDTQPKRVSDTARPVDDDDGYEEYGQSASGEG